LNSVLMLRHIFNSLPGGSQASEGTIDRAKILHPPAKLP